MRAGGTAGDARAALGGSSPQPGQLGLRPAGSDGGGGGRRGCTAAGHQPCSATGPPPRTSPHGHHHLPGPAVSSLPLPPVAHPCALVTVPRAPSRASWGGGRREGAARRTPLPPRLSSGRKAANATCPGLFLRRRHRLLLLLLTPPPRAPPRRRVLRRAPRTSPRATEAPGCARARRRPPPPFPHPSPRARSRASLFGVQGG